LIRWPISNWTKLAWREFRLISRNRDGSRLAAKEGRCGVREDWEMSVLERPTVREVEAMGGCAGVKGVSG
jgi:hypothetical protein